MEILIGLILFGLFIVLLPYIISGVLAIIAVFVGIVALVTAGVKKLFS